MGFPLIPLNPARSADNAAACSSVVSGCWSRPRSRLPHRVADSKQSLLCTYLSAVLLVGLALNSMFGWSWADPIAALVVAAVKEGREAWRGDSCCAPGSLAGAAVPDKDKGCADGCGTNGS